MVYAVTWPLWKLPRARPYFFILTRAWGFSERLAQRYKFWPDGLRLMAQKAKAPAKMMAAAAPSPSVAKTAKT